MSSHNRERAFEMRRSKGTMSDYRSAPVLKSRSEMSSRKKVFSSRGPPIEEKHREYLKPSKRGMEDRREYNERKDYPPMKKSRENYQGSTKESYGRSTRDEPFEPKSRDPYLSRGGRDSFTGNSTRGSMSGRGSYGSSSRGGRGSFGSSRGSRESFQMRSSKPIRESYPSRGSYGYPRGSRDSYSSRGSFAPRGRGDGFSSRGRESYSTRGREVYSGRGKDSSRGREPYPVRGRESYSSRGSESYSGRGRDSYSARGRESYSARGRETYSARGRDTYPSRGMKTSGRGGFHGSKRVSKYDDFPSNSSSSRTSYEMSKKMSSMNEDHYEDDRMYEIKRSSRSFVEKDTARTFKEPSSISRSFSQHHSSSLSGEKFSHKRERSSSASGHYDKERFPEHISKRKSSKDKFEAPTKRSYDEDDDVIGHHTKDHRDGPPQKQQRLIKKEKYRESNSQEYRRTHSSSPLHIKEEKVRERTQERDRSKPRVLERVKKREERVRKVSVGAEEGEPVKVEESERRRVGRVKSREITLEDASTEDSTIHEEIEEEKVLPPDEEELEEPYERHRERSPGGVQITIRSDGERAVNNNSDGFVKPRITGKVFVDLHCPHCPGQNSVTFAKYKYHLDSRNHRHKIENLAYRHSIVLRRIRRQQRAEQKEIEEKWEKEKPEEFKDVISTYCKMCKLAFKSLADRTEEHNESKLHKIQQRYLHPKCEMCRMSFPSRMVYEYHIASIRHLRILSMCNKNGDDGTPENETKEENKEEIDLTNFITMDSVGEDEEVGSEKEEITGKLEDIEKAEEDAKEGEEDERAEEEELVEEEFVMDVEDDADLQEQEGEEQFEPVGKDYIEPMEAAYCKLCHKAIRVDTELGEELIDRHCSTAAHIDNLQFANSEEYMDGEEEEEEDNFEEAGENVVEGDVVVEEMEEVAIKKEEVEEEENPEDRQDYEEENPEDRQDYEEEEPNYEEEMIEHGEDIDLDAAKASSKSKDVKQNGK